MLAGDEFDSALFGRQAVDKPLRHQRRRSGVSLSQGNRQLMVAVRHALEQTNAAEPAEDPRIADSSLTPVLEDVFRTDQVGVASEPT